MTSDNAYYYARSFGYQLCYMLVALSWVNRSKIQMNEFCQALEATARPFRSILVLSLCLDVFSLPFAVYPSLALVCVVFQKMFTQNEF